MNEPLRPEVEEAFTAALQLTRAEQEDYLARRYASQPGLRTEVASLLRAHHSARGFLEPVAPSAPMSVGRYRILRLLGEGGMGAVYEAEQEHPRRIAALKLIRCGYATPELLRRFEQEAQALGRLQHPGIAQIYEAGTARSGFGPQPYFAMEFIRGISLVQHANAHHLQVPERLELMAKVCEAVQHAHQRGIIHRDLKPGNILVDETGQPKILDFGVARFTDGPTRNTGQTGFGQLLGTLAYMSPEQAIADPLELDTRSDVYSLGVILYELLSGELPYPISSRWPEAIEAIRHREATPLGAVRRDCRGDVEIIAAKALEKDKARRYPSAADLAGDIRRYLKHEPLTARRPSAMYHLGKFARRHRAVVAGMATVFMVLIAGFASSMWEAQRARRAGQEALRERDRAAAAEIAATRERDRAVTAERAATAERNRAVLAETQAVHQRNTAIAEKERADRESMTARAISDFLQYDLIEQASPSAQARPHVKPDSDLKVRTVLDRAAARIAGRFDEQPLVEASIRQTAATTYMALGLYPQAHEQLERALDLRRRQLGEPHPETLLTMNSLGQLYEREGKYKDAEPLFRKVLELRTHILGAEHPATLVTMSNLALIEQELGRFADAEPLYLKALEAQRRVLGEDHPDTRISMSSLAILYRAQGRPSQAGPMFAEVVEADRRALGEEHPDTLSNMNNLAVTYWDQGQYEQAEKLYRTVLEIRRRVMGEQHPDTLNSMNNLAVLYYTRRKFSQAEALFLQVLEARRRVLGPEHSETLTTMGNLGRLYLNEGKNAQAEPLFRAVLAVQKRVLGEEHPSTLNNLNSLARVYQDQGKDEEAEALFTRVLEARKRVLGHEHVGTRDTMERLARLYLNEGRYVQAEPLYNEVLAITRRVPTPDDSEIPEIMAALGEVRMGQRRLAEAEWILREALKLQDAGKPDSWQQYEFQSLLGDSLMRQARFAEAEPLLLGGWEGLCRQRNSIPWEMRTAWDDAGRRVVRLYEDWGRPDKVAEWQQKLR